ncbi:MAG: hypothetical protein SPJ82_00660 [Prevotella sp.]|nr:hypothetical protein [Prevotella sp.]
MTRKTNQLRWLVTMLLLVMVTAVTQNAMAQGTLSYVSSSRGFLEDE